MQNKAYLIDIWLYMANLVQIKIFVEQDLIGSIQDLSFGADIYASIMLIDGPVQVFSRGVVNVAAQVYPLQITVTKSGTEIVSIQNAWVHSIDQAFYVGDQVIVMGVRMEAERIIGPVSDATDENVAAEIQRLNNLKAFW